MQFIQCFINTCVSLTYAPVPPACGERITQRTRHYRQIFIQFILNSTMMFIVVKDGLKKISLSVKSLLNSSTDLLF